MKKTTRMIGVIAIAMALTVAFSGVALASPPVCPPIEKDTIKTVTIISCQGMVTEEEAVTWDSTNEDLINSPPLNNQEIIGKMQYKQDLKVTDGMTKFVKDMGVDTGIAPNLNVMVSIGYTQGETIGSLSHDEDVGMGIVANFVPTAGVILCPFASAEVARLPASCIDVDASSKMVVTDVLATTRTKVTMSDAPVSLHYEVDATGSGGAETAAHGHIVATFSAYVEDGSSGNVDDLDADWELCEQGDAASWTLGSKLTHVEKSTANGLWEFHKEMDYTSRIRP